MSELDRLTELSRQIELHEAAAFRLRLERDELRLKLKAADLPPAEPVA